MSNEFVGKHFTAFEPPDLIVMKIAGEVGPTEGGELARRHLEFTRGLSSVYMMIDLGELDTIAGPARKAIADSSQTIPFAAIVVHSAPMRARIIARLLITAINLVRRDRQRILVEFYDNEAEARAALDVHRNTAAAGMGVARA